MGTVLRWGWMAALLAVLAGCSVSPQERMTREQALKQSVDSFVSQAVQGDWSGLYRMTDGSFRSPDQFKKHLTRSWVQGSTLTGADIASMAWVNDTTAKVKLNWIFQSEGVNSYSSETFLWAWQGNGWRYKGRALR